MGFQHINMATFQHIIFFAFDIKLFEIFLIWMWCKCIYHICVVPGMWMFHTNLPSRFARSLNLMYVWLLIEYQQNYPVKYVCELYEFGT
jgi:hypothetical protein